MFRFWHKIISQTYVIIIYTYYIILLYNISYYIAWNSGAHILKYQWKWILNITWKTKDYITLKATFLPAKRYSDFGYDARDYFNLKARRNVKNICRMALHNWSPVIQQDLVLKVHNLYPRRRRKSQDECEIEKMLECNRETVHTTFF